MKPKYLATIAALGLGLASASAQVDITGSTAGRASVHQQILALLSGESYAYTGTNINNASKAIFTGTYNNSTITVRVAWSGSATGLIDLQANNNVAFLSTATPISSGGTSSANANLVEPGPADVAFSDVFVTSTTAPATGLVNKNTYVIPFKWVASAAANSYPAFDNVTPAALRQLYTTSTLPLSQFTGNATDKTVTVVATGRDSGSGTRITSMADMGYGVFAEVVQAEPSVTGSEITGLADFAAGPNGGFDSGGTMANRLNKTSSIGIGGSIVLGYLGLSDAATALTTNGTNNQVAGKELKYNGVTYSADAVRNGNYSLWGYFHMYYKTTFSGSEKTFADALATAVAANPGSSGIVESTMLVERLTDGGNITQKP